jgi:uncharacterized protein (DUF2141 family)
MKMLFIISILLLYPSISKSQYNLTIEISSLRNNNGVVLLELNDENGKMIKGYSEKIVDNQCIIKVEDIQPGKYAFKYFHDENKDKKINTNVLGIPKEGYGFSNNAKGKFGPPSFDKMVFEIKQDTTVKLTPNYIFK